MSRVTFDVYGSAQPQGSKSLMPNGAMLEGGSLDAIAAKVMAHGIDPRPRSGHQERLENLWNRYV